MVGSDRSSESPDCCRSQLIKAEPFPAVYKSSIRPIVLYHKNNLNAIAEKSSFDKNNLADLISSIYFAESMSVEEYSIITAVTMAVATFAGIIAGGLTANPLIGMGVGFALGAAIGAGTGAAIISQQYNVNYNRLETVFTLSVQGGVCGAIGGILGSCMYKDFLTNCMFNNFNFGKNFVLATIKSIIIGGTDGALNLFIKK